MVMHARKLQRISDGYFDKHQAHPYQNSKYSSSKSSYPERYNHDNRIRDSPSGNSYRSDSPDSHSQSPRDRSYHNKSSYSQRVREKERERENREYKTREKERESSRSPKDRRSRDYRDNEHRTNHDRTCVEEKREEKERVTRVGDWSEHISSSGKKYYYNCKTEVSQWEKPREWMDWERHRAKEKDRIFEKNSSGRSSQEKHSNSRAMSGSCQDQKPMSSQPSDERDGYRCSQSGASREDGDGREKRKHSDDSQSQDMDISPGDSTPTSENSYSQPSTYSQDLTTAPVSLAAALPKLMSHPPTTPTTPIMQRSNIYPQVSQRSIMQNTLLAAKVLPQPLPQVPLSQPAPTSAHTSSVPSTPVSLGNLPRLLSQITGGKGLQTLDKKEVSTQEALQTIQTALLLTTAGAASGNQSIVISSQAARQQLQPLTVDTAGCSSLGGGPPTPTHSESQDGVDARKVASPTSSVSSLQSLSQAGTSSLNALRPQVPTLTPSLANYYREDLIGHINTWQAEEIEKQAYKLTDEAHSLGSLTCSKISAELKMARSLVRLAEIQATLQEQRILFLRQQIKDLEEMKSQNSFMSDT